MGYAEISSQDAKLILEQKFDDFEESSMSDFDQGILSGVIETLRYFDLLTLAEYEKLHKRMDVMEEQKALGKAAGLPDKSKRVRL